MTLRTKLEKEYHLVESDRTSLLEAATDVVAILASRLAPPSESFQPAAELSRDEEGAYRAALGFLVGEFQKGPQDDAAVVKRVSDEVEGEPHFDRVRTAAVAAQDIPEGGGEMVFTLDEFVDEFERQNDCTLDLDAARAIIDGRCDMAIVTKDHYRVV